MRDVCNPHIVRFYRQEKNLSMHYTNFTCSEFDNISIILRIVWVNYHLFLYAIFELEKITLLSKYTFRDTKRN